MSKKKQLEITEEAITKEVMKNSVEALIKALGANNPELLEDILSDFITMVKKSAPYKNVCQEIESYAPDLGKYKEIIQAIYNIGQILSGHYYVTIEQNTYLVNRTEVINKNIEVFYQNSHKYLPESTQEQYLASIMQNLNLSQGSKDEILTGQGTQEDMDI